jgi:hypothetical protein
MTPSRLNATLEMAEWLFLKILNSYYYEGTADEQIAASVERFV